MDLSKSTYRLFLARSSKAFLLFGGMIFFARRLGASAFGTFVLFQALQGIFTIPADFGVRGALEKRLSEGSEQERMLGSALSIKLPLLALVSIAILVARDHVNAYLGADLALFLVVIIVLSDLDSFFIHTLRGELRVGETAPLEFMRRFIWVGLGAILVELGYGVLGILIGLICGGAVTLLWAFVKRDTHIGKPSDDNVRSLVEFSKYNFISSVGGRIYQWMDIAVIGFFLSQRYVGAYEVAWQISLIVLLLSKSIALTIFPQISQWDATSETDKIESTLSSALGFALYVSIPALVGSAIYAPDILRFVFGAEYTVAATVLVILMVEKLFQSFNTVVESSVRAIDRPDLAAKATVITAGVNLLLSVPLVLWFGMVGAAVATTVSWGLNTVLHTVYLSRFVSIEVPYLLVGWYTFASVVMGGILIAVKSMVPVAGLVILLAEISIGVAVYVGASAMIPPVRERIIIPGLRVVV